MAFGIFAIQQRSAAVSGGYIHHSRVPVAMIAFAAVDPQAASDLSPGYKLIDLIDKIPSHDGFEYTALAQLCGAPGPAYPN